LARVSLTINGRSYDVACEDGQESHLRKLGAHIDQTVAKLVESVGQVGESRLLVMAGLMIADDLFDAVEQLEAFKQRRISTSGGEAAEDSAGATLDAVAQRIEDIAARLERS
jgi:cell division protein ZapA